MSSDRNVKPLDGVRGLAILAVMGYHSANDVIRGGTFGVDLFFGLSGLLITGQLLRELDEHGGVNLRAFYLRRAGRLLPALIVFLALVGPLALAAFGDLGALVRSTLVTFFYVTDFAVPGVVFPPPSEVYNHTWSLSVEEQFYLVWPPILLAVAWWRRPPAVVMIVAVAAMLLLGAASVAVAGYGATYFLPTGHLWALLAGAAVAVAGDKVMRVAPFVATGAWLVVAAYVLLPMTTTEPALWTVMHALAAVVVLVVLAHAVGRGQDPVRRVLSLAPLVWLGQRSYGLYLYHSALVFVFTPSLLDVRRSVAILLAMVVSLALAELSFRYVEKWPREAAKRAANRMAQERSAPHPSP